MTAQDLIYQSYSLIGQAADSDVVQLPSGTGGTAEISATEQMLTILNQGQEDLCRTCIAIGPEPILDITAVGDQLPPYATLTSADGRIARVPTRVWSNYGSKTYDLKFAEYGQFHMTPIDWYKPRLDGTPTAWADLTSCVALSSTPLAGQTFNMNAFCLPAAFTTTTDIVDTALDDEAIRLLTYWAASQIIWRAIDDPNLQQRASIWWQNYQNGRLMVYERLLSNNRSLGTYFPPLPSLQGQPNIPKSQPIQN